VSTIPQRQDSRALRLALALVAGTLAGPAGASGQSSTDEEALAALMSEAGIPGATIAFVADGDVIWDAAIGVADAAAGAPVTPATVFEAASLTKPVVSYATLRLVERGEFDLDEPLRSYLRYERLEHDAQSHSMTARHVLSHTTGLPNWERGDLLATRVAPGERWGYSGEGFVFLQRVLEVVTGLSLQELLEREVFEPLEMTSSSVVWRPAFHASAATGHDEAGDPVEKRRPSEGNAAASLHTTAIDYGRFLAAVLEGRGLEHQTVIEMLSPVSQVEEPRGGEEHALNLQWGLGWGLQNGDRSTAIWHWGDNGTFRCYVIGYPSQRSGLVYLTNSENGLSIAEDLVSRFFPDSHHAIRWLAY
jgi:CubicO group peptidase (beta-lactamase class C family)